MTASELRALLSQVASGEVPVEDAVLALKKAPFETLDFAMPDTHRQLRQGVAEVIFGAGKTAPQVLEIARSLREAGQKTVLITRLSPEKAEFLSPRLSPFTYHEAGNIAICGEMPVPDGCGKVLVCTAGTSDIPVAEEAVWTAKALGNEVETVYDAGVSGLHRLLSHLDSIMTARVIIAIAGMEGALASVVAGLADCPVIAVPTSVGYGASFGGLSALLSMLNSCASGVSVVNIDNGFGAAYQANLINHLREAT